MKYKSNPTAPLTTREILAVTIVAAIVLAVCIYGLSYICLPESYPPQ